MPVPNGEYVKNAKIGRAVMDADIFISLTHFKGHEATGFGGAIKNIGMGCGSRAGKMEQHSSGKPAVQAGAAAAAATLRQGVRLNDAIQLRRERQGASLTTNKCEGCGRCIGACNFDAIYSIDRQRQRGCWTARWPSTPPAVCAWPPLLPHQPGAGYQPQL